MPVRRNLNINCNRNKKKGFIHLSPLYKCGLRGNMAFLLLITFMVAAFDSVFDVDRSDDVELIIGELSKTCKGFS